MKTTTEMKNQGEGEGEKSSRGKDGRRLEKSEKRKRY